MIAHSVCLDHSQQIMLLTAYAWLIDEADARFDEHLARMQK
jgi:hypothetical protein